MRFLKPIILLFFLVVSSLPIFAQGLPISIERARNNAPENYLVGVGVAKEGTDWESMTLAETRARLEIASVLSQIVQSSKHDLTASSELTGESYSYLEEVTVLVSRVHIIDSWIADMVKTIDGTWWCVIYCDKNNISVIP